uniref:Uncharacterized protein n=1 Tax=Arion vulgaris TaxID=1028688 RepID=A0A0B7BAX8_9EUPU
MNKLVCVNLYLLSSLIPFFDSTTFQKYAVNFMLQSSYRLFIIERSKHRGQHKMGKQKS